MSVIKLEHTIKKQQLDKILTAINHLSGVVAALRQTVDDLADRVVMTGPQPKETPKAVPEFVPDEPA